MNNDQKKPAEELPEKELEGIVGGLKEFDLVATLDGHKADKGVIADAKVGFDLSTPAFAVAHRAGHGD